MKRNILLTPGPTTTSFTVKQSQIIPDICPREKDFGKLLESIALDLLKVINASPKDYTSILLTGSGTAAMEAAISSVINKGRLLVLENGAYGYRFYEIAKAHSIPVTRIKFPWGKIIDYNSLDTYLKKHSNIEAVAIIHNETTTGILNNIEEAGKIVKKHNKTYIIDAISSFAGKLIDINKVKADYLIGSSNKCLQGIPGLSFVICKKSELEKTKTFPVRSYYLNLYRNYKYFENYNQTPFTPAITTIYALREALDELFKEGIENRVERYENLWNLLTLGMALLGFEFLLEPEDESKLITTYIEPPFFNFKEVHDKLYKKGIIIYPGKLLNKSTFRIGNIGDINYKDIEYFLETLKNILENTK